MSTHTLQAFMGSTDARSHTPSLHSLSSAGLLLFLTLMGRLGGPFPNSECLLQLSLHSEWSHKSSPVQSGPIRSHPGTQRGGGVGDGGSFIFLSLLFSPSLCSFCFLPSTPPPPPSSVYFQSSVLLVSAVLTGGIFEKAPSADGELATPGLDESTEREEE